MSQETTRKILIEVCVDSVESAIAAERGGAGRVELCDNLLEGGTTPSAGAIAVARENLTIDLHVIIRPRGGDFCYSDTEFEVMKHDVGIAKQLGANGVVLGILNREGEVDRERTGALIELARPLRVTFHRGFDMTRDPYEALETIIALGAERILTSGQEASILEGLELITELIRRANHRIIIMPCGGVNERNIRKVIAASGANEIHVTGFSKIESEMRYRNERVFMGGAMRPPEYLRSITDADKISRLKLALD